MRHQRCGIRLPPMKAQIFDLIHHARDEGISTVELMRELYADRKAPSRFTIKAHVWQINEVLAETRYAIVSDRRRWFLRRKAAA
jgi:hypothetical protein